MNTRSRTIAGFWVVLIVVGAQLLTVGMVPPVAEASRTSTVDTHPSKQKADVHPPTAGNTSNSYAAAKTTRIFLPLAASSSSNAGSCAPIPGESYDAIIPENTSDRPAEEHPDLNLSIRGYEPTSSVKQGLVDYGGNTDSGAPQLYGLFGDQRTPTFGTQYRVYEWDWECDCRSDLITNWPVTLSGMKVSPGEPLHVPNSGYSIGTLSGGYDVLVLYASKQRITLKYTRDDNVIDGYTLHVEGVCVEPELLQLYQQWNDDGRSRLPALRAGQAFGRARSGEIMVAIRDTGHFMDPRSRKDWWQGR